MTIEKALVDAKMGNTKAQQYLYEQYKVSLFTIYLLVVRFSDVGCDGSEIAANKDVLAASDWEIGKNG